MRKWILFRRRNHNVHYLWNGHYPVLITAHADLPAMTGLDLPQWGWSHRHRNIDEESWKTLFKQLETSRQRTFKFDSVDYTIEERGTFQEP